MFQQLILIGNLGNDPELRYTPSGVPVANFRLAVNQTWTDQGGQKKEKVTWFHVAVWNKQAEVVAQYLTKGRQVLVVGEVEGAEAYTSKTGELAANVKVKATSVRFLGQAGDGGTKTESSGYTAQERKETVDIDIPF